MFFIEPERGNQALNPHLSSGEQLTEWAYGVRQSTLLMVLGVLASMVIATLLTAFLFGVKAFPVFWIIWFALIAGCQKLLRKDYLLALTDRRLLVVQIRTPMWKPDPFSQLDSWGYPLDNMPRVDFEPGRLNAKLKIVEVARPFKAMFGLKAGRKDNRKAVIRIVEALESTRRQSTRTATA